MKAPPSCRFVCWGIVLLACGPAAAQSLPSLADMVKAKNWFFDQAVHPETHLIYGRVNLDDPDRWRKVVFPSPDMIRNRTNSDAEVPNVSNSAIAGGLFLGQLVDVYNATQDQGCATQAKVIFEGLKSLAAASERKGFIARSLLPGDPTKAHFLNSSVDQYTFYVYSLYKYFHSPLAGEEEKRDIRRILADIATMIEQDGTILATDGTPAWVSDIEAIRSDRSSRLLEVYLVAHDVTGDPRWREAYLQKVREANHGRFASLLDPFKIRYPYHPRNSKYGPDFAPLMAIWQTQYSLVPLFELETDITLKAAYLEMMRTNARIAERYGKSGPEMVMIMLAQNRPLFFAIETPSEKVYFEELGKKVAKLVATAEKWRVEMPKGDPLASSLTHVGIPFLGATEVYWSGVARGVLKPAP